MLTANKIAETMTRQVLKVRLTWTLVNPFMWDLARGLVLDLSVPLLSTHESKTQRLPVHGD